MNFIMVSSHNWLIHNWKYCFRQNWPDPKLTKTQNCTHLPPDLSLEIVLTNKNCIRRKSKSQHTFVFLTKCLLGRIINGTEGARLLKPSKLVTDPNHETWVLGLFLVKQGFSWFKNPHTWLILVTWKSDFSFSQLSLSKTIQPYSDFFRQ